MRTLTGTGTFVRFFIRRDRFGMFWWLLGGVVLYVSQAVSIDVLYTTQAEFDMAAAAMEKNTALIAMAGPARALNTIGGQVAWQVGAFGAILAGFMSMFLLGRHTRAEEESGRDELIRSGVVGRHAPIAAAVIVVTMANVLLGIGIAGSLIAYGLPPAGSMSLGLAATLAGLVFMSIALLAAQFTASTRSMYGLTGAAIAVAYVLRVIGDLGNPVLSWLSPIGWGQAMRPYAGEIWWPALISVAAAVVLTVIALKVFDRRDIGASVFATRPGPAHAGKGLRNEFGLAWRLQRGTFIGWSVGMLLAGLAYGSLGKDIGAILGDASEIFAQGGGSLADGFYATTALMMAMMSSGFAIQSVLRIRAEENAGRVESLLATGLSKTRWMWSHALIAAAGTMIIIGLGGLGTGLAYGLVSGDGSQILVLTAASLAHTPAAWALAAFTLLLVGFHPRWAAGGWLALVFSFVVLYFGATLQLPEWIMDVSPFNHVPLVPVQDFTFVPFLAVSLAAAVLCLAGTIGFRRRDIG